MRGRQPVDHAQDGSQPGVADQGYGVASKAAVHICMPGGSGAPWHERVRVLHPAAIDHGWPARCGSTCCSRSASLAAKATIMKVGLACPAVTKAELLATNRFLTPCTARSESTT